MKSLGGSIFIHDAIRLDYCLAEAVDSLCAVCDDVVAVDAESTDGTIEMLEQCRRSHNNLRVITGAKWDCAPKEKRLTVLANLAKSHLKTDWHFMLQADEVIHETSFPAIREAVERNGFTAFSATRLNFFGDLNHHLKIDMPHCNKPCADRVIRLAVLEAKAIGDAESLEIPGNLCSDDYLDTIKIFHYGMARDDWKFVDKCIEMQGWFHSPEYVDKRFLQAKAAGKPFDWKLFKTRDMLERVNMPHPVFAQGWVEERQAKKIPVE